MPRASSPVSVYTVSSSDSDDYAPSDTPPSKKRRISHAKSRTANGVGLKAKQAVAGATVKSGKAEQAGKGGKAAVMDVEDAASCISRPHAAAYHLTGRVQEVQEALLSWFEDVREKRGMPWRKPYDDSLSMEQKGQRAYEIWVSEIMLQQTQVATVIAYWKRWIERWPTIADLAQADVEEVNAAWRGLGYYRRARSLLAGAKTVMGDPKYKGRLPHDPLKLEKEIDGVGRYTAGAICSMAYGVRTPIVDGNIHRLLTRLLGIHATQTSPAVIKALWNAATDLVAALPVDERDGIAGDWNQALMELGSQVCKPAAPDCGECVLREGCNAYSELSTPPPRPGRGKECALCEPIPGTGSVIPSVTIFPMRKEKKASREENEVVCITEWRGGDHEPCWLFVKRPEKGLLAGLFEPPTTPVQPDTAPSHRQSALTTLSTILSIPDATLEEMTVSHTIHGSIPHIFSHINMTYHIHHLVLGPTSAMGTRDRPVPRDGAVWLDASQVEAANVGTGVEKVWAEVFGSWGSFKVGAMKNGGKGKAGTVGKGKAGSGAKVDKKGPDVRAEGKVVKKVMMPLMPSKV